MKAVPGTSIELTPVNVMPTNCTSCAAAGVTLIFATACSATNFTRPFGFLTTEKLLASSVSTSQVSAPAGGVWIAEVKSGFLKSQST